MKTVSSPSSFRAPLERSAAEGTDAGAARRKLTLEAPVSGRLGRVGHTRIDIEGDSPSATRLTATGWANPLYTLSMGLIGPAMLGETVRTSKLPMDAATAAAIDALRTLGAQHGVTGVLLGLERGHASFMFESTPGAFVSGGGHSKELGAAAGALEEAARAVLSRRG